MENNISTVAFRSNLYPVVKDIYDDATFRSKIHDPFSLEQLKKQYNLTPLQEEEYAHASVHCAYAEKGDYPWGTIINEQGIKIVVCRCLNTECSYFHSCRPDFDPCELLILEENEKAQPAIFEAEEVTEINYVEDEGDAEAALKLFAAEKAKDADVAEKETSKATGKVKIPDDLFIVMEPVTREPIMQAPSPAPARKIDFNSFAETTQNDIIKAEPTERTIINAGPGTGKTWTLIEKIIYMVNEGKADAENILVLCFSRSAVEIVRGRLSDAARAGRLGYEWQDVDVRTFDSFATYFLDWVLNNRRQVLPKQFRLEECSYDQRIDAAVSVFEKEKDLLAEYEHIFVDEVQDLVGARAELVLSMLNGLPGSCGFTVLGDSCQSIFDYRAESDPSMMTSEQFYQNIFKSYPKANYCSLTENHRQGNDFGQLTIPYRKAILTGNEEECVSAATDLLTRIPSLPVKLTRFSKSDASNYVGQGRTLGFLTRTNGQALQISAWLRNADVPHVLHRGTGSNDFGDWIGRILCDCKNETIDENDFVAKYLMLFPDAEYENARKHWMALASTHQGQSKSRYEISELLKELLKYAREPMLFESGDEPNYAITVSNIHRAKGKEFDSVIVIDDVIEAMTRPDTEGLLEHKVCYVALTRPKKQIERAEIAARDKRIYITQNDDQSKRCAKAGGFGNKCYISHFEVGGDSDIDLPSFAADVERQQYIKNQAYPGMRLKLLKCPERTKSYVVYRIVPEEKESLVLGYTSAPFARELERAIQHIKSINCKVYFKLYPSALCDVYVHKITTCISMRAPFPAGARTFGDACVWNGVSITGFATVDKDTY